MQLDSGESFAGESAGRFYRYRRLRGRSKLAVAALVALLGTMLSAYGYRELSLPSWALAAPHVGQLHPSPQLPAGSSPLLLQFTIQVSTPITWRQLGQRQLGIPESLILETLRCRDRTSTLPSDSDKNVPRTHLRMIPQNLTA